MKKLVTLFLLLHFVPYLRAQDFMNTKYCDSSIIILSSKHSSACIMAGKEISTRILTQRLNMFRSSAYERKKAILCRRVSLSLLYSGTLLLIGGRVVYSESRNHGGNTPSYMIFGGLGTCVVSFVFGSKSNRHSKNSVDLYNREICRRQR